MSDIRRIEQAFAREEVPEFKVGDTVDVHVRIREGDKERIQIFNGTVIRRRGGGLGATYTVRRIVQGQGVERTFPLHSPFIKQVTVRRSGRVRRARLYFLRDRTGKATRLKEIITRKTAAAPKARRPAPTEPEPAPEPEPVEASEATND
jgi:large subunit ribosomal protein L19